MEDAVRPNPEKDPDDWVTGDEPMTGAQSSYLQTLSQEAGEEFDPSLSKAEASRRIDDLQARTGRSAADADPADDTAAGGSEAAEDQA